MQIAQPTTFCKNKKKIFKELVIVFLVILALSSIEHLFSDEGRSYLEHISENFFDMLFLFIIIFIFDFFNKDCIYYNESQFQIEKGINESILQIYNYKDITKINYMPYLRLYTITMKQENTYIDFHPDHYDSNEFKKLLYILESYQPISKGFYMPSGGLNTPLAYVATVILLGFIFLLIAIGYIIR